MIHVLIIFSIIAVLLVLRQNLILTLAVVTGYIHVFVANSKLDYFIQDIWLAIDREVLLPIPMFMLAGAVMARGEIAKRLIAIMIAVTAPLRGGLGVAAIASCALFASISGSSVVTMLAVGSIMYPALLKEGYSKTYALGALMSGGTLGIIIPPSIALIVYGIITEVSVIDLFFAGVLPGLTLTGLLCIYSFAVNFNMPSRKFVFSEVVVALRQGFLALLLPVILLGGIYSGYFTATESAVVALLYALLLEALVYKDIDVRGFLSIIADTVRLLGTLLPLLAIAHSLNTILEFEGIPHQLAQVVDETFTSPWTLIFGVNLLLLALGCIMEVFAAIMVLSNILLPMVEAKGFDPVHFGIIMIVNLEIGFLTPPVGLNLLVATVAFKESFGLVIRAAIPFVLLMLVGLAIIVVFPQLSLALLR
jgi:C4-dicarboxylate transporter, DctM subunit